MVIRTCTADGITTIDLDGRFGAESGEALSQTLADVVLEGHKAVVLNLLGVIAIDAAGLGELARTFKFIQAQGGELRIVVESEAIRELLIRTKLATVLPMYTSTADAFTSFAEASPA